ncbi:MAG: hypothetical protein LBE08_08370, partial [Bifidobacteriaceae bacterium]|nr:hypothetical protein [Bifidobacteriaceae bacterium]
MNQVAVASRTAVLSVFGQFMRGRRRSAVGAVLLSLALAAVAGVGVQEGMAQLTALGGTGYAQQIQAENGAKLLAVLLGAAFFFWVLVELLPRSEWISTYLRSHEMRGLSRAVVAATRVGIFGGLAALISGPALVLSISGSIGLGGVQAALMVLTAAVAGVSWARIFHAVWTALRAPAARAPWLGWPATEVSVGGVVAAVGVWLSWPRGGAGTGMLLWSAWEHGVLVWLALLSVGGAVAATFALSRMAGVGGGAPRTRTVLEWQPTAAFPLLRLIVRMVFRSRDFRLVFGEVATMAVLGLLAL